MRIFRLNPTRMAQSRAVVQKSRIATVFASAHNPSPFILLSCLVLITDLLIAKTASPFILWHFFQKTATCNSSTTKITAIYGFFRFFCVAWIVTVYLMCPWLLREKGLTTHFANFRSLWLRSPLNWFSVNFRFWFF